MECMSGFDSAPNYIGTYQCLCGTRMYVDESGSCTYCHYLCNNCASDSNYDCMDGCNPDVSNVIEDGQSCYCADGYVLSQVTNDTEYYKQYECVALDCDIGQEIRGEKCVPIEDSKTNTTTIVVIVVSIMLVGLILGIILGNKKIRKKMLKCMN